MIKIGYFKNVYCRHVQQQHSILTPMSHYYEYRQVSDISRTKSQHLNDSRTVLRLSLSNPLKPDVKSRMKM